MDHKNLDAWKKSIDLVEMIYKLSALFPDEERYGLTSQIRRAAVSVPSNLAGTAPQENDVYVLCLCYSKYDEKENLFGAYRAYRCSS